MDLVELVSNGLNENTGGFPLTI